MEGGKGNVRKMWMGKDQERGDRIGGDNYGDEGGKW